MVVDLDIPKGYKLNDLAPVTWEVFVVNGAALIPADVAGTRDEATVSEKSAQFKIPVTAEAGTAQIVIRMTCAIVRENSTLCRLATGTWKLDLTTAADAPESELKFSFSP